MQKIAVVFIGLCFMSVWPGAARTNDRQPWGRVTDSVLLEGTKAIDSLAMRADTAQVRILQQWGERAGVVGHLNVMITDWIGQIEGQHSDWWSESMEEKGFGQAFREEVVTDMFRIQAIRSSPYWLPEDWAALERGEATPKTLMEKRGVGEEQYGEILQDILNTWIQQTITKMGIRVTILQHEAATQDGGAEGDRKK